jgi:selenium metabolism protein YedF
MVEIDCRGKACPQPVLMAKEALERAGGEFLLLLDDASSCENVERFLRRQGAAVEVEKKGREFHLRVGKGEAAEEAKRVLKSETVVVYINSSLLGVGDEALGSILMRSFLKTFVDLEQKPSRLILINSGVRLATEDSPVLETLKCLSEEGVEILACGTCLDFYGLKEKVRVGKISNMYEIVETLVGADRLIRP